MQSKSFATTQTNLPPVISFSIEGFWTHVTMDGTIGTDQHNNRWFYRNGKLYSEHTFRVIPVPKKDSPKKLVSADEYFMQMRASDRLISIEKFRQHELNIRSYNVGKLGGVA